MSLKQVFLPTLNAPLVFLLTVFFFVGLIEVNPYVDASFRSTFGVFSSIMLAFGIFWWALVDARFRKFELSTMYKVLVLFLAPVGVLLYAFKSRKSSFAWLLVVKIILFILLCNVVAYIGSLLGIRFVT
ncbi:hypothetical protein [Shewanella sp. YLB-07]|uniref:hypothetical protein n=1 Tax=Shewanella sp. YLB-07 TaxID=2601268 RepID=UPI00128BEB23|nr:hypothetical protein [Shewanella sp. YLB-07]MPY26200.1 hypothetical protein [Shewanella sp. YLB-07]